MFTTVNTTLTRAVLGTLGTALCAGVCLVAATAPAAAAEAPRSAKVHYADLNLANKAGRATLDRRLLSAARAVCATGDRSPDAAMDETHCIHQAMTAARAQVPAPVTPAAL
ncbi:MAG: UrcA family protein [Sphingomonadaceae bacterium]|nr:UrcA family protein [Sphingomonadaceae bacterium]